MRRPASWKWSNVPVPGVYVALLLAGLVVHVFVRWGLFRQAWVGHAVGWPMAFIGLLVVIWAVWTIEAMDISKPTAIVTTGPYALSRNPMYVAWTFIYGGIGVIVNSAWPLMFLPVAIIFTHYISVIHEEHRLEEEFGDEYRRYRNKVRRYL